MNKYVLCAIFFLMINILSLSAQEKSYMEKVKLKGCSYSTLPDSEWKGRDAAVVLSQTYPYLNDENDAVSSQAVY